MSILVQDILSSTRIANNETYNEKHSEQEYLDALNTVLRTINIYLVNKESHWIAKEKTIIVDDGLFKVPSDFLKIKQIYRLEDGEYIPYNGKWKILRNKITMDKRITSIVLDYYYMLSSITSKDDEIDLPDYLEDLFITYLTNVLGGATPKDIMQLISSQLDSLIGVTNFNTLERQMPFYI
jgi:hypothetical protein